MFQCDACKAGDHNLCGGIIQLSNGDRFLCECECLEFLEVD